jgi:YidC/Oxa1 family membrane protein insertase
MDNRRLILLLVFSFSLIMLWDAWQKQSQPKLAPTAKTAPTAGAAAGAVPTPTLPPAGPAAVPGAVPGSAAVVAGAATAKIRTDLYVAEISSLGGDITRLELVRIPRPKTSRRISCVFDNGGKHIYLAQSGVIGEGMPNHKTEWKLVAGEHVLKDGEQKLEVRLEAPAANGGKVAKTYVFQRGSYQIEVRHEGVAPGAHAYYQITRDGKPAEGQNNSMMMGVVTFTGPAVFTDAEKFQKVEFADILKNKAKFAQKADNGWLAMVQHYFVAAWLPAAGTQREYFMRKVGEDLYSAGVILPVGADGKSTISLYAGPQEQDKLEKIAPGLDLVVDYGWLTVIAAPLFWVLGCDLQAGRQLGLGHHRPHHAAQGNFLPAVGRKLQVDGQDARADAQADETEGNLRRRQAAPEPGNDGAVQEGEGEPARRLPAGAGPDPGLHRALLGAAGHGRDAQRALAGLDHRPLGQGSLLRAAADHGRHDVHPDQAQSDAAGSDPGQGDALHADHFHRDVPLVPGRSGALLDGEQHPLDRPAMADHAHGRGGREEVVALPVASDRGNRRRLSR